MSDKQTIALTMPKWGMAMSSGKVVEWLVEAGVRVRKGDEILDIETDKAVVAMEAPADGVLSRQVAQPGDELPVGGLLGVITQGTEDPVAVDAFVETFRSHFVVEDAGSEADQAAEKIVINDISIAYRKYPSRQDSDKLPIVFIHGFGGDQNGWMFNVTALTEQYPVYTVDLPAHGESSRQVGNGSLGGLAEVVAGLMSALAEPRVHLVGHSLGAAVAVEIALQQPEQVASLVLLSGVGAGTAVDREYIEGFIAANRRARLKPYIQRLFSDPKYVTRDMLEGLLRAKRIEGTDAALSKLAQASIYAEEGARPADKLTLLRVPVLVVWGGQDQVADVAQTDSLPANVEVQIIDQAGHMGHIEAAGQLNTLIRAFLDTSH